MNNIEVRLKDCAAQENCDSEEYDLMQEGAREIEALRTQLAKANERISQYESKQDKGADLLIKLAKSNASMASLELELAKANERVRELELIAKGLCYTEGTVRGDKAYADWCEYQEQLRKEQNQC